MTKISSCCKLLSKLKPGGYLSSSLPYSTKSPVDRKPKDTLSVSHKVGAYGQPTSFSHPNLLQDDEILPNVKSHEFKERRCKLLQNIEKYEANKNKMDNKAHIVIIPGSCKKYMTEKIPYVFRQDSDLAYLSGCLEPDSVLLLTAISGHYESVLFVRGKDAQAELWDGPRTGVDQVPEFFSVDKGLPWNEFSNYLRSLTKSLRNCVLWHDYLSNIHPDITFAIKDNWPSDAPYESPRPFIHRQRLIKSPAEQLLMQRTCEIGSEAITRTIRTSQNELRTNLQSDSTTWVVPEAALWARVDYECRLLGAQQLAYPPVVAGGTRANIIHYINNNNYVHDGELVLMDAGCEYYGYNSDITRTWPVSGKFSSIQRSLYEMLLSVQVELIKRCEQRTPLNQLFQIMCQLIGKGLKELGVLPSECTSNEDLSRAAYVFCPHHVGHYLGMDVHDTSSIPRNIPLEPGMIVTIEPGVYISEQNTLANPMYRGLGMRIEDDILITDHGLTVLTSHCPKHPDDLERIMKSSLI